MGKVSIIVVVVILVAILFYSFTKKDRQILNQPSFYDNNFTISDIDGNTLNLNDFKGKKLLIVNVASKCGFTPQYEELQKLYEQYGDKLNIVGFPCNQFKNQEPGTPSEIKDFCTSNYGVTFPLTEKIDVKGDNQNPIYEWLTTKDKNGYSDSTVKWNFQKYLLDENGHLIDYFYSITNPLSDKITKYLK
ncbi:MAG: glutathione peroxidase [Saprospiraceae bacterium]